MATDNELHTLHRYFIWMDRMRVHFDEVIQKTGNHFRSDQGAQIDAFLYMSYWYAGMYVVIEGWRELQLSDKKIDHLLSSSDHVELLRRYRNGAFHFQKTYFDNKFTDLWSSKEIVAWLRELNVSFSEFFLRWSRSRKADLQGG